MRILVCGAGVLGGSLASNLLRAGKDVTLLARGAWARRIAADGLVIERRFRPGKVISRIPVVTELGPDDLYDAIFVVVRYSQLNALMDPLRHNASRTIVLVGNNVRASAYAAALPGKDVLCAFASSAGHREPDRIVAIDLKRITIGPPGPTAPAGFDGEALVRRVFDGAGYRVNWQPNMADWLLCHAAFVLPIAYACYHVDGDLRRLRGDAAYRDRVTDAILEGYRAIEGAGHEILPASDAAYEGPAFRRSCRRLLGLMSRFAGLGRLCAGDHAMSAPDEMAALSRDLTAFFDEHGARYPTWSELQRDAADYLA